MFSPRARTIVAAPAVNRESAAITSASAVANAYLTVDHSLVVKACKSAG